MYLPASYLYTLLLLWRTSWSPYSTDVGVASEILHPNSIFSMNSFMNAKPNTDYAYEKVQKYLIPNGFENFRKIINQVYEN